MPFDCIQPDSRIRTAIFDIETDGLLDRLTRVHVLSIRDFERKITHTFRRNEHEDTIAEGLAMLAEAEFVVGHNIIHFDLPAISKVYPDFELSGRIRDTLVLSRMIFADEKERDFGRFESGKMPGKLIGQHGLEAWGHRLGMHKGDYKDVMEAKAKEAGLTDPDAISDFVWGTWNQEMEDYCANGDVPITTLLWQRLEAKRWSPDAVVLEHQIHSLMGTQEQNGILFDVEAAEDLAHELGQEADRLTATAIAHYGKWWRPAKKRVVKMLWDDPDGINKKKKYDAPRAEFGEDLSRAIWGEVTVPSKTLKYKFEIGKPHARWEGVPFTPIELAEFNPNSRDQVVDRFTTVYKWNPVDFTDTGRPTVDDSVLRNLSGHIPMAEELAEIFYYKKRIGQIATGANAWLKKVGKDGYIHAYVNVGGTISGRASHVSPNLAQVPKVKSKKGVGILKGRAGDHGWECRRLFKVPEGWFMVGTDLSGIELRCFGELLAKYDNGAYLELVLHGDIHTYNMELAGLDSRDQAKTFIYALIYGAGDVKLGSIVSPLADEEEQRAIGVRLRERFMKGLPAFARVVADIKRAAARGYLIGLDGRRLYVRSPHSALNTQLQSNAALIAKKWVCLTEERLEEQGLRQGWKYDFVNLLWIHDEDQQGARNREIAEIVASTCKLAAADAGKFFNYVCPIDAEFKIGTDWAATH